MAFLKWRRSCKTRQKVLATSAFVYHLCFTTHETFIFPNYHLLHFDVETTFPFNNFPYLALHSQFFLTPMILRWHRPPLPQGYKTENQHGSGRSTPDHQASRDASSTAKVRTDFTFTTVPPSISSIRVAARDVFTKRYLTLAKCSRDFVLAIEISCRVLCRVNPNVAKDAPIDSSEEVTERKQRETTGVLSAKITSGWCVPGIQMTWRFATFSWGSLSRMCRSQYMP
ncbi:hypothetical protein K504DRAFT_445443 [Pleomassaria siparia CBS 279.74]|uniref:Uncharacterized protein n=1 Tax=Pleomassaria siparia CBS 279.74 TaxID=1314801 RepID=A0A6G1KNQ5_9PLEO|nr:hypothetical protein K504DRAFT_445443 [Pleomassaria siparia CBS 279.74]